MSNNYSGKLNLLKFLNACIVTVKGNTSTKRGVFIPLDDNNVFVSADENMKPRGAYTTSSPLRTSSPASTATPTAYASRCQRKHANG